MQAGCIENTSNVEYCIGRPIYHNNNVPRSHETAKQNDLLSGYQVHLTPGLKPEREQMTDIIKCSGGEALDFASPVSPGEKVVIVSCEEDLSMCEGCVDAGVPVYSAELILGGVLRQQLDFKSYPSSSFL